MLEIAAPSLFWIAGFYFLRSPLGHSDGGTVYEAALPCADTTTCTDKCVRFYDDADTTVTSFDSATIVTLTYYGSASNTCESEGSWSVESDNLDVSALFTIAQSTSNH